MPISWTVLASHHVCQNSGKLLLVLYLWSIFRHCYHLLSNVGFFTTHTKSFMLLPCRDLQALQLHFNCTTSLCLREEIQKLWTDTKLLSELDQLYPGTAVLSFNELWSIVLAMHGMQSFLCECLELWWCLTRVPPELDAVLWQSETGSAGSL